MGVGVPWAPDGHYVSPYANTLADLMLRGGQQRADALRRSGEISGQMWQGVGNAVAGTLGALAKSREEAPIRALEEKAKGLDVQVKQGELAGQQRVVADAHALDTAMGSGDDPALIEQQLPGHLRLPFREAWQKSETAKQTLADAKVKYQLALHDSIGAEAHGLTIVGAHTNPEAVSALLADAKSQGDPDADRYLSALQQNPASAGDIVNALVGRSEKQRTLTGQEADRTLRQTTEQRAAAQAAATTANLQADNLRADAAATETARHNKAMELRPVAGAVGATDVADAVQGMMDGTNPPLLPGRASKEYTSMLAEAKRRGYDLATAATDWVATQKHIATLNGAQQLRLNQSISALPELLDTVDALASKWKGGKFPPLNRANLALAKNGAYGQDVASVARQLDSQIADVTADLGSVYMGGNSPTDQALGLAAKSLSGDWSEKVLHDMVSLARGNVTIRRNSIKNVGVQGASESNPYAPPAQAPAASPNAKDPLGILGGAK